jgi:hypothetical protein
MSPLNVGESWGTTTLPDKAADNPAGLADEESSDRLKTPSQPANAMFVDA